MEDRLVQIFRSTSPAQRRRGKAWYALAEQAVERMASEYGVSQVRVACIMAITSPRCQLVQNLARTERALRGESVKGFPYMDEAVLSPIASINGPKVVPFAKAILGKDALVLDTWALAALGLPDKPTREEFRQAHAAYVAAAKRCKQSLRDFQAIIWIAMRDGAVNSAGRTLGHRDIHELLEVN
jgi:hypothetical protein